MQSFMRRLCILIIVLLGIFSNGHVFADGSDLANHWAAPQFQEWLNKDIIQGYDGGSLKPNKAISRAEFTALANKAFGFIHELETHYSDVPQHAWYYQEIKKGVAAGYIQGYGDGTIKPMQGITREEAAVMLDRILQLENENKSDNELLFNDWDSISKWSLTAVERIVAAGYIKGYEDATFKPQKAITRAEAVVMLSRASGEIVHQAGTYGLEEGKKTYSRNVTITAGNVKLTNMLIKGDLLLAEAIREADIILENVTVEGKVRIFGGNVHINGNSDMKQVYVDKKTGTIRIVMRDRTKIGTMTIQSDTEMNTDENTAIEHLILDRSTRIYGEGSIGLAEINANGVNIELFPKKIKIKDGLKAIVESKEYPSSPHHQDETIRDTVPAGGSGRSGGGSGNGSDSGNSGDDSKVSVTGITLDHVELTLKVGDTVSLTATVHPAKATNKSITWSSDDESVAEVAGGVVTAKAAGTATITTTTVDGGFTATSRITVFVPAAKPSIASVQITPDDELIIRFDVVINQSGGLADWAAVDDVIDWGGKSLGADYSGSWSIVGGQSVLTIVITDPTGRTLEVGDTISIKSSANVRDENNTSEASDASSIVSGSWVIPVAGITLDHADLTLKVGNSSTLTATVHPANATNKSVIWSSDDESVAEVADGVVTAKSSGMATLKATTVDGGFTASSQIYVRNGRADVEISASDLPVIQQYPFALSIRNAFDEQETKVDGNKQVTVTVEDGDESVKIFDEAVWFNQGEASVTSLNIANSGTYEFSITIDGIRDPIVIRGIEVVHALEAVLRAQTEDELNRSLLALGTLYPLEFDSDSIVMDYLQAYLDDLSVSRPQTASAVQARVNVINDLLTAPRFVTGYPEIDELQDIWFNFRLMLDREGTVYYLVVEDGESPPTAEEVKAGIYSGAAVIATGSKSLDLGSYGWGTVTGLAAETDYNLYLVTESDSGALSAPPIMLNVTTIPYMPAAFVDGYPQIDELSDNHFSLQMRATKDSMMHYILIPRDASVPTSEQVKSRSHPGVIRSGSVELPINTIRYTYIRNLQPNFEFDLYAVIEDSVVNTLQLEPTKLQMTTLPDQAPLIVSGPNILSSTENAIKIWLFLNKPGRIYYMLVEEGATPPTSQEVQAGAPYEDVIPTKTGTSNPNTSFTIDVGGLSVDTEYVFYIVTESLANSLSEQPASVAVKTLPYQPAQFVSNNPYTNHEQVDKFYLGMNLTKPGIVHYLVVHRDSAAPTAEQVQEGNPYGGVTPVAAESTTADPNAYELVEGLYPNTEYDIYLVVEDAVVGLQAPVKLQTQTIPDSPPGFWEVPNVRDLSDSELKLQMGIIRPGYGYYLLQLAGESRPTSQQVKDNPTGTVDLTHVGGGRWTPIYNLTPDTNYEIFVVVESIYGALQAEPIKLEFKTLEETEPPVFISDSPLTLDVTSNSFFLYYRLDKPGTVHYIVVGPDAQEPTADQVVMGESYDGIPIIRSGYADYVLSYVFPSFYFNKLTPDTTYVVYIVGKGIGNKTTAVHKVEVTTLE